MRMIWKSARKNAGNLFNHLREDYAFKTEACAGVSLGITGLFALYNGYLGLIAGSIWHGSICAFHLVLAAIRGMILYTEWQNRRYGSRQRAVRRRKTFLVSGALLLVLDVSLIAPVSLMVRMQKPVSMGLIPAIAMAAYTFDKLTMAFIHVRRRACRHNSNVLVVELRTINLIDALVSILTLQNTLIMVKQTPGGAQSMMAFAAVTSAAIYAVIVFLSVRMLIRGIKACPAAWLNAPRA